MKLKFIKQADEVDVCFINSDGEISEFSYVEMVNRLYNEKVVQIPIFEGDFSEAEKESMSSLMNEIETKCLESNQVIEDSL